MAMPLLVIIGWLQLMFLTRSVQLFSLLMNYISFVMIILPYQMVLPCRGVKSPHFTFRSRCRIHFVSFCF